MVNVLRGNKRNATKTYEEEKSCVERKTLIDRPLIFLKNVFLKSNIMTYSNFGSPKNGLDLAKLYRFAVQF